MKTELTTITPKWARSVLDKLQKDQDDKTFKQRSPRNRAIDRYASDMVAGKWLVTHQGIAFDDNDHLIDGQNRLWAVVKANVNVKMMVTTGVPGNGSITAMDVIDNGMVRSLANHLQISHGFGAEAHEASAFVKAVIGVFSQSFLVTTLPKSSPQVSAQQALYILNDLGLSRDFERCRVLLPAKKMRHRNLVATWSLYHAAHPDEAELFAIDYSTLENLKARSPALLLTRFMSTLTKRARRDDPQLSRICSHALFCHYKGIQLAQLSPSKEALQWLVEANEKIGAKIIDRVFVKH